MSRYSYSKAPFELKANKGVANGYAGLDANAHAAQLPDFSLYANRKKDWALASFRALKDNGFFYDDFGEEQLTNKWVVTLTGTASYSLDRSFIDINTGTSVNSSFLMEAYTRMFWTVAENYLYAKVTNLGTATQIKIHIYLFYKNVDNYVGFRVESGATAADWFAVAKLAGVETAVDTGVVLDVTTTLRMEIVHRGTEGVAEYYINNVLVATITTNVGNLDYARPRIYVENTEAVNKRVAIRKILMVGPD